MESNQSANVSNFFKDDFKEMFMVFFTNPTDGHLKNFKKSSDKALLEAGILMGSVFVIYFICMMIMVGTSSMGALFKVSLIPIIMMLLISVFSFAIKSASGKPDFKQELLTGGLCGIPLGMGVILAMILNFVTDGGSSVAMNPIGGGVAGMIILVYLLLMMIGVFQQSLKAAGSNDTLSWFASPAAIILAGYLTSQIVYNVLS